MSDKRFKFDPDSTPEVYYKGPLQCPGAVPGLWNLDVLTPEFYYKGPTPVPSAVPGLWNLDVLKPVAAQVCYGWRHQTCANTGLLGLEAANLCQNSFARPEGSKPVPTQVC